MNGRRLASALKRVLKKLEYLNPTTGCGSTNVYTPILNAWQDHTTRSDPRQCKFTTCSEFINDIYNISIRCYGVQENNISNCVAPITKYETIFDKSNLEEVFIKAFSIALEGRMGPVWLDIPSDVQHSVIEKNVFDNIPNVLSKIYDNISKTNFINNKKDENEKISKLFHRLKDHYY